VPEPTAGAAPVCIQKRNGGGGEKGVWRREKKRTVKDDASTVVDTGPSRCRWRGRRWPCCPLRRGRAGARAGPGGGCRAPRKRPARGLAPSQGGKRVLGYGQFNSMLRDLFHQLVCVSIQL